MSPGAHVATAIELLDLIAAKRAPADVVAGNYFRTHRYIGSKDRAQIAGLVYGVLRTRAQLDWWVARVGLASSNRARVLASLALEGWTREGIEAAFDGGKFRAAPLSAEEVSALRGFEGGTREHRDQPPAVRHNVPEWVFQDFAHVFGRDVHKELAALARPAQLDLRVNTLKTDRAAARRALADAGIAAQTTAWSPVGLRVEGRPPLSASDPFKNGWVEVQDEGSQLAAALVDAKAGMRVCDFCAGAGGKTLAIAAQLKNTGRIDACDIEQRRMVDGAKRLRRAGVSNARFLALSSERDPWVKRHKDGYDRVLIDAPCSGTGTWRRNPDAKWNLTPKDIEELAALQARILDSAARLVKPGGRLIYVTCSMLAREDEDQIAAFRARRPDFSVVRADGVWDAAVGGERPPSVETFARLTPARTDTDGFFVAILERAAAA